ncbi:M50 family metallopeptidase [Acholeplasma sp. OttesenSCG-928-E16]|nr:M50 family metallopeptidase [Acholeplasma sp. OttesenSCG-928-E16]
MKILKKLKWLFFIIGAFLLGMVAGIFHDADVFFKLGKAFNTTPWYYYLILFVLCFYVTLAVHELTHFFYFVTHKIKGKALYLTALLFVKRDSKWRLKFVPKMFMLLGGLVVPDLNKIESEEDYEREVKVFAGSLISAPIATIIFGVLFFIVELLVVFISSNILLIGLFTISFIFIELFTILYVLASTVSSTVAYGDFPAYKKMKEDKKFQLAQIVQYLSFSSNITEKTEDFIFCKVVSMLKNENNFYDQFSMMLLQYYIEEVVFANKKIVPELDEKILSLSGSRLINSDAGLQLYCCKLYYVYSNIDANIALNSFMKMETRFNSERVSTYWKLKTKHLLNISDESIFLSDDKNIETDKMSFIFKPLFDYYQEEKDTIVRLKPKIIQEKIE